MKLKQTVFIVIITVLVVVTLAIFFDRYELITYGKNNELAVYDRMTHQLCTFMSYSTDNDNKYDAIWLCGKQTRKTSFILHKSVNKQKEIEEFLDEK